MWYNISEVMQMSEHNKEILEESVFSLEVKGFKITDTEKQIVREMLEGKRTLDSIIQEYIARGRAYARA